MFRTSSRAVARPRVADASDTAVRLTLPGKQFLFAQTSIVSSLMPEDESFLIKPETAKFVNANGDGWLNDALKANYPSFIGAYNYVNHVQEPEQAVGFIADAALRRLIVDRDENIYVYYVDLLIATHKPSHPQLANKILSKKIEYLSMGCESMVSTCSACGHQAEDEMDFCSHLSFNKGKSFVDRQGQKRVICEELGSAQPGSCVFSEASYLTETPAFGGAIVRNILPIGDDQSVEILMPRKAAAKDAVQRFVHT